MNSFVEMFLRAGEFIGNQEVLSLRLTIHEALGVDLWTHNRLTCNEVAAVWLDNIGAERDIILHQRGGVLQGISDTHLACDPLHFPLLFPHGELGWHLTVGNQGDATNHNSNRISCREFAAYTLYNVECVCRWVLIAASRCKIISARGFHANYRNACA
jgi:hypothetical protein